MLNFFSVDEGKSIKPHLLCFERQTKISWFDLNAVQCFSIYNSAICMTKKQKAILSESTH